MTDMFEKLAAPFPADRVSWRVGSVKRDGTAAMALAYIDARDVMERLDEACGPGGWQCRYPHAERKTVCDVGVKLGDEWIWKADGAGDSDIEAEKGALSDAFKRAAVRWGVGRYLYELPSPWVPIDANKRITKEGEAQLRRLLENRAPPPKVAVAGVVTSAQLQEAQEAAKSGRKIPAQAKRDGDHDRYRAMIDDASPDELMELTVSFEEWTATAPVQWLDSLRDRMELRREELNGVVAVADEVAEMVDAFRATVGPASPAPVAGSHAPHSPAR